MKFSDVGLESPKSNQLHYDNCGASLKIQDLKLLRFNHGSGKLRIEFSARRVLRDLILFVISGRVARRMSHEN